MACQIELRESGKPLTDEIDQTSLRSVYTLNASSNNSSRSSSFKGSPLYSYLNDVYYRSGSFSSSCQCHHVRRSSSRRSHRAHQLSSLSELHRKSMRRQRSVHIPHNKRNNSTKQREFVKEALKEVEEAKIKRRRTIVYVIVGMFFFLLVCCVMAVIVTLTHQSDFISGNKTITYYTFSPDPRVIGMKDTKRTDKFNSSKGE